MKNIPAQLLHELKQLAGPKGFRAAAAHDISDPRGRYQGNSAFVLRPADTCTAAKLVQRCAEASLGIIPIGGGTGLVAGHLNFNDRATVLLSTERMTAIRQCNPDNRHIIAEAGVVLHDVQSRAQQHGLLFPLSLASEGSCTIGGNLSTNAGGVQVLRYGNTRDLVLGVEAIMPDGSVLHDLSTLRKNNTGYDIKNLLIGAEGTLGLITAASLKLSPALAHQHTALCAVKSAQDALRLLDHMQVQLGETISAFELISKQGLIFLEQHFPQLQQAITPPPVWSVLLESSVSTSVDNRAAFEQALASALERGLISDASIANSAHQREKLWALREHLPLANAKVGAVVSFDISVPLDSVALFISHATHAIEQLNLNLRINCFGHVGDGNLHFNIFPMAGHKASQYTDKRESIRQCIYQLTADLDGSFSAEHGVGRDKILELERFGDPVRLHLMRSIKTALDPKGVFNPGALLR